MSIANGRQSGQQSSPHYCLTDEFFAQRTASNPGLGQQMADLDRQIYQMIVDGQLNDARGSVLSVPTVVHVIHNNGPENISTSQVQYAISEINQALRNLGYYDPNSGVDTEIELCLANQDPNGAATNGINYVANPLTNFTMETQDQSLKNLSRWDQTQYLNIWVVGSITSLFSGPGVAGYSTLPASHGNPNDGFVVEYNYFGSTQDDNKVSVHELGHYLGLYHTFQGGCPNNNCLTDGDRVCDTPPDASTQRPPCTATPNTCSTDADDTSTNNPFRPVSLGGLGDQPDLFQDYMDYSDLQCMNTFTEGQKTRMRNFLQTTRASLLNGNRCAPPCTNPATASFTASATTITIGGTVNFTNTSVGANTYDWKVNGQSFATTLNSSYTFNTLGMYDVTLLAETGTAGCQDSMIMTIEVVCQAQASFTPPNGPLQPGQSGTFTNNSTGAASYTWLVDGIPAGTTQDLNYTFPLAGIYQVQLVATTSGCNDTSLIAVQVGFCADKSYYQWRFGQYAGIDFSSGTAVPTPLTPMEAFEQAGAISDQNGDLLFYVSPGVISTSQEIAGVWNRNDQLMPNGNFTLSDNGCTSALQGGMILQHPGNANQYFIFTNSCAENQYAGGFSYHLVDMTLDNGLGDVVQKNQNIWNNGNESMAAVRHCNGRDYWIVIYDANTYTLQFFLLDNNGFNMTPQNSLALGQGVRNFLKFSSDGTKLAMYNYDPSTQIRYILLMDFDNSTGAASINVNLPFMNDAGFAYEFSPDSRYLYIMGVDLQPTAHFLHRYDTDANPIIPTLSTQPININTNGLGVRLFQLAPDGKIYGLMSWENALGTIDFPNSPNATYNHNSFQLTSGAMTRSSLVAVPGNSYRDPYPQIGGSTTVCVGDQVTYTLSFDPCGTNGILWDYRGGGTLGTTTDTTAGITFGGVGVDTLIATKLADCSSLSDTLLITIGTGTPVNLGPDTVLCSGPILLDAGSGYAMYAWNTGASSQSINVTTSGWYWVDVTGTNGCVERDSIWVAPIPAAPQPDLGPDTTYCGAIIVLDPGNGFNSYVWQDNTTDSTYTVFQAGTYTVEVVGPCGQTGVDTVEIGACVGVDEVAGGRWLDIYPNPNRGSFRVEAEFLRPAREAKFELVDPLGRIVWTEVRKQSGTQISEEIVLPELSEGVYVLRMTRGAESFLGRMVIRK